MKITLTCGVFAGVLLAAGVLSAQTQAPDEVQISVGGYEIAANGAETPQGVWRGTGPLVMGKAIVGIFSMGGCGAFSATRPPNSFNDDARVGWRVEITPIKIVNHNVTFRLRWVRAFDKGGEGVQAPNEDVEVTLRPGEARPLDTVAVLPTVAPAVDGGPCRTKAVSLRAVADFPERDRRLIGADVWLIERLPNGKEETQLQSVRGLPHRPIAFYFDGLAEGAKRIDVAGKLVAHPMGGGLEVSVEGTKSRADPGQEGYQANRWFRSTLHMNPGEIVEVALPVEKNETVTTRVLAIRIRAKQIR